MPRGCWKARRQSESWNDAAGKVGFAWIYLDLAFSTPGVPLRRSSTRRVPRLRDGFAWICLDLPGFGPPHSGPSTFPAAFAPFAVSPRLTRTSRIWSDLPGFDHPHPSPSAPPAVSSLRHEPAPHENKLDLLECTTRQRSLNRRECTSRERIVQRGAPTAWNALRDSVLRTVAERLPRRGWSLNPELQPHTAWRLEPQFPWIRPSSLKPVRTARRPRPLPP